LKIGLLGFPKVGKTSLFNILTGSQLEVEKFSTGKAEPHLGVAKVPDARLDRLAAMFKPRRVTPAVVEYLDIQGLAKGEAKDPLFLREMRNVDAIAHVVRAFSDDEIPHPEGSLSPRRDLETMETEFLLSDLEVASRRVEKLRLGLRKAKSAEDEKELGILTRCLESLEREIPIRALEFTPDEEKRIRGFAFLTAKPLLGVVNMDESDAGKIGEFRSLFELDPIAARPKVVLCAVSAKIEMEIARLSPADAAAFLEDLELAEPCLDRILRASHELLGLSVFFTTGEDEVKAWSIPRSCPAQRAAGAIHSDIERGFIRAEVVAYEKLMEVGSLASARDKGLLRQEGKEYRVVDGDVINFKFNV
jgi:GTP-binding protein YchF